MGPGLAAGFGLMAVLWLRFDAPHLYRTWSCARAGARPLAPAVAARQPALTPVLRPVAALWMSGHFMLGVSFAAMTERLPGGDGNGPRSQLSLALLTAAIALAYTFAANGFLLAAVKAATGRDVWVQRVWRYRVLIDLGVVALSVAPLSA